MNDNASLAISPSRSNLGGLPQRLVQDGVVDESGMHAALQAAIDRKTSFVTQLVASGTVKARDIAIAASAEYGVPLFDLNSLTIDLEAVRSVSDKLLDKAIEQVDTSMPNLSDEEGMDLESLEVSGGDEDAGGEIARDDIEDA